MSTPKLPIQLYLSAGLIPELILALSTEREMYSRGLIQSGRPRVTFDEWNKGACVEIFDKVSYLRLGDERKFLGSDGPDRNNHVAAYDK